MNSLLPASDDKTKPKTKTSNKKGPLVDHADDNSDNDNNDDGDNDTDGSIVPRQYHGVVDVASLPRWADATVPALPPQEPTGNDVSDDPLRPPSSASRFPFQEAINRQIIFWKNGDLLRFEVDVIVNSTNETLSERNGLSERILAMGGKDLAHECSVLEGCRTGEAKMTNGYALHAKHVIHTVGPRYNAKYKTAAESALHNCYRSSMELLKEADLSSIAFPVINSAKRGYPPENGCHMALRTIRRFLERFGKGIDAVVFVVTEPADIEIYETLLPLYFPRNHAEEMYAISRLPADVGNEMGEPVQAERMIRIGDMPRPTMSTNQTNTPLENPLASWVQPDENDDRDNSVADFTRMQGDHDSSRKEEITSKMSKNDEQVYRYMRLFRKARTENLVDIASKNIIYLSGVDSLGRTIVCVVGKYYDPSVLPNDRVLLYLVNFLDNVADRDYVVVYFNTEATSDNHPEYSFVRDVYQSLHPKYRRNLKTLYVVHPTFWLRLAITIMGTLFTSDISEKIRSLDRIQDLYDHISVRQLKIPDFVLQYDVAINGAVSLPPSEHFDAL